MKFNRLELLAAVKEGLEGQREVHARRLVEYDATVDQWKRDWHRDHDGEWKEYADRLKAMIDRGEVITHDNLNTHSSFGTNRGVRPPKVYQSPSSRDIGSRPSEIYREPKELRNIVDLLELADDEYVTTNALKEMGYSAQTLRAAVDYLSTYQEEKRRKAADKDQVPAA